MLTNIRYKIATYFMKKACKQIEHGEIKKGLETCKRAIWIVPPSKELSDMCKKWVQLIEKSSKEES